MNTAGHWSASGANWTQQTLSRWARGHGPLTASGVWSWNGITVAIPPILTPAELTEWTPWTRDTALAQNRRGSYLLGGRARTPCGGRYHGRTAATQTPVYACKRRLTTKPGEPQRCSCRSIPVTVLDDHVWTKIQGALTDPARLTELTATPTRTPAPDIGDATLGGSVADTAAPIDQIQQAIAAEYRAAREDGYDAATARLMVAALHAELQHAHDNLARLSAVRAALTTSSTVGIDTTPADVVELLQQARAQPDRLDTHGKQRVLDALGVSAHHRLHHLPRQRRDRLTTHPARIRTALATGLPDLPPAPGHPRDQRGDHRCTTPPDPHQP